jgi:hypothetical protein
MISEARAVQAGFSKVSTASKEAISTLKSMVFGLWRFAMCTENSQKFD